MDSYVYGLVKRNQKTLPAATQYATAVAIRKSCDRILELCYLHLQARATILDTLDRTQNLSKLGRDYNSAILGHNAKVHTRILEAKEKLADVSAVEGALILVAANLHPRIVLNADTMYALNSRATKEMKEVQAELAQLTRNREILTNCVLEAAAQISLDKHKQLNSEVIQESDLFQEALKAAHEGTLLYNPDSKAKWSSFAYSRMHDIVGNFIADKSRVVAIPRSTIERFNVVVRAIAATQSVDTKVLMDCANKLVQNEKALAYTEQEIETILNNMQGPVSLDMGFEDDEDKPQRNTIGDILVVDNKTEEEISKMFIQRNVANALKSKCSELEFTIVNSLWGLSEEPRDLTQTHEYVKHKFPNKKISKIRVKRIGEKVLLRLKNDENLHAIWQEI